MALLNKIRLKSLNNKQNSKFNIIIIILISVLTLFSYTFYVTINNYLNENINKNIKCRSFFLDYDIRKETEQEVKNKIINIEHIVDFFSDSEYRTVVNISAFATSLTDGDIIFYAANNDTIPPIVKGSNLFSDYKIICPNKIVASLDNSVLFKLNKDDYINTKEYLNKEMIATYHSYDYSKETPQISNTFKEKFMIIGLYDSANAYSDNNACYTTRENVLRINNLQNANLNTNGNVYAHPIIVLDDSKNIDFVKSKLNNLGYQIIPRASYDDVMIDFINYIAIALLVTSLVVYLVLNKIYFKKSVKINYDKIGILKSLGYSSYQITETIFINSLMTIIYGFGISLIIYTITYIISTFILENINLAFNVFSLSYPILFIFIMIMILLLAAFIESINLYFKVKRTSTMNVLND